MIFLLLNYTHKNVQVLYRKTYGAMTDMTSKNTTKGKRYQNDEWMLEMARKSFSLFLKIF